MGLHGRGEWEGLEDSEGRSRWGSGLELTEFESEAAGDVGRWESSQEDLPFLAWVLGGQGAADRTGGRTGTWGGLRVLRAGPTAPTPWLPRMCPPHEGTVPPLCTQG